MNLLSRRMDSVEVVRKKSRRIKGLKWAELRPQGPFPGKRNSSARACVKRGNAYETKVGRFLKRQLSEGALVGELTLRQWILFADENGVGWAQPDAYLITGQRILLMEMKLTQTDTATPQLLSLYLPLIRHIFNAPIVCLQVCRNLRYVPKKFVESPQELLNNPGAGVYTWHFRGE